MTELELRAHRIEAVGAIENLMSLHAYYHAADQNREELLNCWSKTRGDEIIWSMEGVESKTQEFTLIVTGESILSTVELQLVPVISQ